MALLGGRGSTGVEIEAQSLQMAATATPGPQLQAPCHGQPPSATAQSLCCPHCSVLPRPCCPQLTFAVFIPYVRQLLDVTGLLSEAACVPLKMACMRLQIVCCLLMMLLTMLLAMFLVMLLSP